MGNYFVIPGVNCSILGCHVSRRTKHKGLSIFKVPSGDSEFETTLRNKLIVMVTRDRVIDTKLKEQINNRNIYRTLPMEWGYVHLCCFEVFAF